MTRFGAVMTIAIGPLFSQRFHPDGCENRCGHDGTSFRAEVAVDRCSKCVPPEQVSVEDKDKVVPVFHTKNFPHSNCKKGPAAKPDNHTAYLIGRSKARMQTMVRNTVPRAPTRR